MPHKIHTEPYHVGDIAPKDGRYVCVPCGFQKRLQTGETFGECLSCFKDEGWHGPWEEQDTEDALVDNTSVEETEHHFHIPGEAAQEVAEGQELWEEVQKPKEDA